MQRVQRTPILIFGEGKTEKVFLDHVRCLYREQLLEFRVKVDHANGGSPETIVHELISRHLSMARYSKVLLLIDADKPIDSELKAIIEAHGIECILSRPQCLEGMLLAILDDVKAAHKNDSKKLKRYFQKTYLKADDRTRIERLLKQKCPQLFPKSLLESKRSSISELDELLEFLQV